MGEAERIRRTQGLKESPEIEEAEQMNPRIRDKLNGENNEVLVRAFRKGEFIDQFTTLPPEDPKVTLQRLPKCMQNRGRK